MFCTFLLLLSNIFQSPCSSKIYIIHKTTFNKKQEYICRGSFPPRMALPTLFLQSVVRWKLPIELLRTSELFHHLDIVWIFSLLGRKFRKPVTVNKTVIAKKKRITLAVLNILVQYVKTDKIQVKPKECPYSCSVQSITTNAIRKNTNFIFKALNVTWKISIRWPFC